MKLLTLRCAAVLLTAVFLGACTSTPPSSAISVPGAPRYADYPSPDIPAGLTVSDVVRTRHLNAWTALQAGDVRAASREYNAVLKLAPNLYPAQTGLGFTHLANRQYREAQPRFEAAIAANDRYLPAWVGQAEALLGLKRDTEAIAAMERVLALDPKRELVRSRLELVRFRVSQSSIEAGQKARAAGRYDEAVRQFDQALALSPQSTMILRELTQVQMSAERFDEAEAYARRVIQIEPREGEWQALLGDVLEARGRFADASDAYTRADRLEPNQDWRARSRDLRERAQMAALPPGFANLATAATITRADVAAYLGIRLNDLVDGAPARATTVATDLRNHWATPWILSATRAGIMTTFPNHTFQPGTTVRRGDLAAVVVELVRIAAANNPRVTLTAWQAARPTLTDVAPANVFYRPASLAVASGAMTTDADQRFSPTRPATGAELDAVVRRISALTAR